MDIFFYKAMIEQYNRACSRFEDCPLVLMSNIKLTLIITTTSNNFALRIYKNLYNSKYLFMTFSDNNNT